MLKSGGKCKEGEKRNTEGGLLIKKIMQTSKMQSKIILYSKFHPNLTIRKSSNVREGGWEWVLTLQPKNAMFKTS